MIPVKQATETDCFRACVASVLELDLETVPDFVGNHDFQHGPTWYEAFSDWLEKRGMTSIILGDTEIPKLLRSSNGLLCVVGINYREDVPGHAVVGRFHIDADEVRFEIAHNPGDGIVEPDEDAELTFHFFLPIDPKGCLP